MAKVIIICCCFLFAAGLFNGAGDTIQFHYNSSIFKDLGSWWMHDWTRAYERDPDGNLVKRKIWIFYYPSWILDGWHFLKLLEILSYIAATLFGVISVRPVLDPVKKPRFLYSWSFILLLLISARTLGFYLAWKLL